MDTSFEEVYKKHPRLRPEEGDSEELLNIKLHYAWIRSMTPEEREEFDRLEAHAERKAEVESLIQSYEVNKQIKDSALAFAKDMGFKARRAIDEQDRAEAEKYIGYIRTAKETMKLIDEDQIRIRLEIKDVRRNGTWHERLQAKRKARQQRKS